MVVKSDIDCCLSLSYVLHLANLTLEEVDDIRSVATEISVDFHAKVGLRTPRSVTCDTCEGTPCT